MHIGLRHTYYEAMISSGIGIMVLTAYVSTRAELDPVVQAPFDLLVLTFSSITVIGGLIARSHCIRLNEDVKEGKFKPSRFKLIKEGALNPKYYARILDDGNESEKDDEYTTLQLIPKRIQRKLFDGREIEAELVIDQIKDFPIAVHFDETFIFTRLSTFSAEPLHLIPKKRILQQRLVAVVLILISISAVLLLSMQDLSYLGTKVKFDRASSSGEVQTKQDLANKLLESGAKLKPYDPRQITGKVDVANFFADIGKEDRAEETLEQARKSSEQMQEQTLWEAFVLLNTGRFYLKTNKPESAVLPLEKCVEDLKARPEKNLLVPILGWWQFSRMSTDQIRHEALLSLAIAYDESGQLEKATRTYKLLINEDSQDRKIQDEEYDHIRLASFLRRQGRPDKAEEEINKTIALVDKEFKGREAARNNRLIGLGIWCFTKNELPSGEQLLKEAKKEDNGKNPLLLNFLAETLKLEGKGEEAVPLFKKSLSLLEKDKTGAEWTWPALSMIDIELTKEDSQADLDSIQKIIKVREQTFGKSHVRSACPLRTLGVYYMKNGEYEKALPALQECLTRRESVLGAQHPHVVEVKRDLVRYFEQTSQTEKAKELEQKTNITVSYPVL